MRRTVDSGRGHAPLPAAVVLVGIVALAVIVPVKAAAGARPVPMLSARAGSAPKLVRAMVDSARGYGGPISNESTITYWADAAYRGSVRPSPHPRTRPFDHLRMWTEVGFPEVYLVLSEWISNDETWFKVRLPNRPNGRTGWVREQELGPLHLVRTHLVLDEAALRLTLYRRGHRIFSAPVGIGKPTTPTPTGNFWVTEKFPAQGGVYGPFAFGTSDNSVLTDWPGGGVIGIHGTDEPSLIPGRPSHGCIRLLNQDVTALWPLLPVGTPLTIR
jgi:hypothetical protein